MRLLFLPFLFLICCKPNRVAPDGSKICVHAVADQEEITVHSTTGLFYGVYDGAAKKPLQEEKLSLNLADVLMDSVLEAIDAKISLGYFCPLRLIDSQRVSIKCDSLALPIVLRALTKNNPRLGFRYTKHYLFVVDNFKGAATFQNLSVDYN